MSVYETIPGAFEFEVCTWEEEDGSPYAWKVQLPHQCDDWEITYGRDSSHAEAVAAMEQFLAEGQAALERLRTIGP